MQQHLLDGNEKELPATALIIGKLDQQILTKEQQTFNRLIKKIEKLQGELQQTTVILDKHLNYYGKHIHPLILEITTLKKDVVKLMYGFLTTGKGLSAKEKNALRFLLNDLLNEIFSIEQKEPDKDLKEIFDAVSVEGENADEQHLVEMKEMMGGLFEKMGLHVNLDDLNSQMSEEDFMRKMAEIKDTFEQQSDRGKNTTRKKTKKQLEKEERERQLEEARGKSISNIYRQLAKVFHPDLEQDPGIKLEKEELMKRLTTAKEGGDLLTILQLELAWIHKEDAHLNQMSNDKLNLYNITLKEQVKELEEQVEALLYHPRYELLHVFVMTPGGLKYIDWKSEKHELDGIKRELVGSIAGLSQDSKKAIKTLKEIIRWV
jgi:hypothetical protein